ncbi:MAG: hypothetical protein J1F16_04535 [Muribaculaceae bacterium]|nr:hypothetical protein [Muribaculaceae bacterium]
MKGILKTGLFAVAGVMLATSCSNEDLMPNATGNGNEGVVTFSLNIENVIGSRAISDGTGANTLVYQVFDAKGNNLTSLNGKETGISYPYQGLSIRLAKGQSYQIAFWAQNSNCTAFNTDDLTDVTVDYNGLNNDEARDAFYSVESFTVSGDATITTTLRRPFAQINLGATQEDYEAASAAGIDIATSQVVLNKANTKINLLTGEVSEPIAVIYGFSKTPAKYSTPETLTVSVENTATGTVEPTEFHYLSMSYILAPVAKTTLEDLSFTLHPSSGNDITISDGLTNVPVQRNWRTNILGTFLSNEINFEIVIDPSYYGDNNNAEDHKIADGVDFYNNTYYLYGLTGLKWFQTQMNKATSAATSHNSIKKTGTSIFTGQTVKLMTDVDLNNASWTPLGNNGLIFNGTFDGDNHTVSNLKVSVSKEKSAGFFSTVRGTVQNLKLKNVNIAGDWKAGAVSGDGLCGHFINCHVEGGSITSIPNKDKDNDDGNNVGGITGYLSAEGTAYIENSSVKNLKIKAYRDVGGIAGTVGGANAYIKNCTVDGVDVIADQTMPYKEEGKAPNVGEVYGRLVNGATQEKIEVKVTNTNTHVFQVVEGKVTLDVTDLELIPSASDIVNEIILESSMTGESTKSASYGSTAFKLENGVIIDGKGNTFTSTTQKGEYTSLINAVSGTAQNMNLRGAVRALFIGNGVNGDIYFKNITVDNTLYAFNSDAGNKEFGVYFEGCRLNGWTSFSNVHKEVIFKNCEFGKGSKAGWAYEFIRPYNPCEFIGCSFDEGFEMDATQSSSIVLKNCKYAGELLTDENISKLLGGEEKPETLLIQND